MDDHLDTSAGAAFTLREPRLDDVERLAHVHVQAWRETYADQLPDEFFGERALEFRRSLWRRMVGDPAPGSRTVLAELHGEIVGFASAGTPVSPEQPAPASLELFMIYLLEAHHGCGAAQAMLDAVLGDEPAFLWVAAENPRAQAFYERNRFRADGLEKPDDRVPTFLERRMVRRRYWRRDWNFSAKRPRRALE
ncbi:MAG: GNAT family N-acetyltransferase [Microcella sp.]|uniref:GNAT family N-acetyltransferase n=1 Tax=Microcella sp. TaxID=1913979 RepID=UPI0024C8CA47|nr:GNAT family N-acetyltransferase [Microcella sp.]UYN84327.1 MAG: GNAT family N-acetyltransferase [Microcella sp.]